MKMLAHAAALVAILLVPLLGSGCGGNSYPKKAAQGDADAQYLQGVAYHLGSGVPQSDAEAVKWFRKSAEQGNARAQTVLAECYAAGQGVPQDPVEAYQWASLGVAGGFNGAVVCRDKIAGRLTAEQRAEGEKRAADFSAKHPPAAAK